jgi:hypothetical protein
MVMFTPLEIDLRRGFKLCTLFADYFDEKRMELYGDKKTTMPKEKKYGSHRVP